MKRQQRIIETSWARGYARVLYELKVPAEDIEETRNLFAQTPELLEVLTNPTIFIAKKEKVIDRIFPSSIRNFLKVVCRYEKMNRIGEIFEAYDSYCRQQKRILQAQLTCVEPPDERSGWKRSGSFSAGSTERMRLRWKSRGIRGCSADLFCMWAATSMTGA